MNIKDLKPMSSLAHRYGAKCIVYGPPGSSKTPLIVTAPRPVVCVVEPGLLSARRAEFDKIPAWEAPTVKHIDDFFEWFFNSNEAKNFDTLGIDSVSQMAEIYLKHELSKKTGAGNEAHGKKAYGDMAKAVKKKMDELFYMPNKHIYLIAKQGEDDTLKQKRPYFPGQELNTYVPHLFDEVLHIGLKTIPGIVGGPILAFQCKESYDIKARDRSGNLNEFEPPNLTEIFNKVMA